MDHCDRLWRSTPATRPPTPPPRLAHLQVTQYHVALASRPVPTPRTRLLMPSISENLHSPSVADTDKSAPRAALQQLPSRSRSSHAQLQQKCYQLPSKNSAYRRSLAQQGRMRATRLRQIKVTTEVTFQRPRPAGGAHSGRLPAPGTAGYVATRPAAKKFCAGLPNLHQYFASRRVVRAPPGAVTTAARSPELPVWNTAGLRHFAGRRPEILAQLSPGCVRRIAGLPVMLAHGIQERRARRRRRRPSTGASTPSGAYQSPASAEVVRAG